MRGRLWTVNVVTTVLIITLSVVLPVVVVRTLNAANTVGPDGPAGPDEAGAAWDPHGYIAIFSVMVGVPVLAAGSLALALTAARRKAGLAVGLLTAVMAGCYQLGFAAILPRWLLGTAIAATVLTFGAGVAGIAAARPDPRLADPPWPKVS